MSFQTTSGKKKWHLANQGVSTPLTLFCVCLCIPLAFSFCHTSTVTVSQYLFWEVVDQWNDTHTHTYLLYTRWFSLAHMPCWTHKPVLFSMYVQAKRHSLLVHCHFWGHWGKNLTPHLLIHTKRDTHALSVVSSRDVAAAKELHQTNYPLQRQRWEEKERREIGIN